MTISSTTNRPAAVAGNGATTAFAFAYPYRASSDLRVLLRDTTSLVDTLQTEGAHYTVAGSANAGTGGFDSATINFVTAPATGQNVIINRQVPLTQSLDPTNGAALSAPNIEGALDRLTLQLQSLREMIARAPILPEGNTLANLTLPDVRAALANNLLAINATGDGYTAVATSTLSAGQAVTAFVQTLLDDTTAAAFLTTLGLSAFFQTLLDDADASTMRTSLGLRWLEGTVAAVNFASIANGANSVAQNITVTGAVFGDFVVISASGTLSALVPVGYVSAADTVTFYLVNQSGGAVDLGSQDYYARVFKRGG